MAKINFLVRDSRLEPAREVVAAVVADRIIDVGNYQEEEYVEGVVTITRFGNVRSSVMELRAGTWRVTITTPFKDKIHRLVRISDSDEIISLSLDSSEITTAIGYSSDFKEEVDVGPLQLTQDDAPYKFSKLTPSRGLEGSVTRRSAPHSIEANIHKVSITVNKFVRSKTKMERTEFPEYGNFDEKLHFWCANWGEKAVLQPARLWRSEKDSQKEDISLCIVKIQIPTSSGIPHDPLDKITIQADFLDQRYTVILPLPRFTTNVTLDELNIEFKFLNARTVISPDINRLIGVRLITRDSRFDAVSQFLASGDFPSAFTIWSSLAEELLQDKYKSPIGAAAASLVLVHALSSNRLDGNSEQWSRWLNRLCTSFPSLPDARVADAWLDAIDESMTVERKDAITQKFWGAVDQGIPIFSESVRLLSRGAEWACGNQRSDSKLKAVRWLAGRVLPGNALTAIRHSEA